MWKSSLLLGLLLPMAACVEYPTGGSARLHLDMVDQPSFRAQENPRPLPEGAVPTRDWEPPLTLDAAARLKNPVPATAGSVEQGRVLMGIYCTPCHGVSGRGDGTVAAKMVKPADLTSAKYAAATDGFFYGVIRAGSGLMPGYAESLAPGERWHVVNYLRTLQRK
jgi:mono/diheme cytochrome c family protein